MMEAHECTCEATCCCDPPPVAPALSVAAGPSPLLLAARAVMAVRPTNWDDADDPHAVAAWTALQDALKPADPDDLGCGICALGFVQGDPCLTDIDLGPVHAACCGPERESYVDLATGEPLKEGQPIPTPWTWSGLFAAKPAALTPGVTILRHHDGRTGSFVAIEADGRLRVQSLKGKGFWIFAPHQCDRVEPETACAASPMIDSECIHPACGCGEGPCKATGGTTRPGSADHG